MFIGLLLLLAGAVTEPSLHLLINRRKSHFSFEHVNLHELITGKVKNLLYAFASLGTDFKILSTILAQFLFNGLFTDLSCALEINFIAKEDNDILFVSIVRT